MNFHLTKSFVNKAEKLCRKNPQLKHDLTKQFSLFQANPNHPSLKWHKLKGKRSSNYTMWIQGDLRALGVKEDGVYIFFDLVSHDEY